MPLATNHLVAKTQSFWEVSLAYRKRPEGSGSLSVGKAFRLLGDVIETVGAERLLYRRALYLQHYIVCGDELTDDEKGKDLA